MPQDTTQITLAEVIDAGKDALTAGSNALPATSLLGEAGSEEYHKNMTRLQDYAAAKMLHRLGADTTAPHELDSGDGLPTDITARIDIMTGIEETIAPLRVRTDVLDTIARNVSDAMDEVIADRLGMAEQQPGHSPLSAVKLAEIVDAGADVLHQRKLPSSENSLLAGVGSDRYYEDMSLLTRYASTELLERAGVDTTVEHGHRHVDSAPAFATAYSDLRASLVEKGAGDNVANEVTKNATRAMDAMIDMRLGKGPER